MAARSLLLVVVVVMLLLLHFSLLLFVLPSREATRWPFLCPSRL